MARRPRRGGGRPAAPRLDESSAQPRQEDPGDERDLAPDLSGQATARRAGVSGSQLNTAAGFVLGALADVLLINYLRGGPTQVRAWLSAKFLNRVAGSTSTATAPAPSTGGGGGGTAKTQ